MIVLITSVRRKAVIMGLFAATLTASIGAVGAQQPYAAPGDQYYGAPAIPNPQIAPSRWDRARFANQPIRRAPAIAVCAASLYFGSAGIATCGATGAQIKTLTVVAPWPFMNTLSSYPRDWPIRRSPRDSGLHHLPA